MFSEQDLIEYMDMLKQRAEDKAQREAEALAAQLEAEAERDSLMNESFRSSVTHRMSTRTLSPDEAPEPLALTTKTTVE